MNRSLAGGAVASLGMVLLAGCAAPDAVAHEDHVVRSEFSQELHEQLPAEIRESGVVSVVGDSNPPWRAVGTGGETVGLQVDLMEEFSEILGVQFRSDMVTGLPGVKLGVQGGRNDAGFGPLLSNETTQQDMLFIEYTIGRMSFLFPEGADPLTSVEDLCGATVSYIAGTAIFTTAIDQFSEECRKLGLEPIDDLELPDLNAAILALESDRAHAAGMSAHQVIYADSENPGKYGYYLTTEDEWPFDRLGMGFAQENEELAIAVQGAWETVMDNGVYEDLMIEYGMEDIMVDRPVLTLDAP